VNIANFVYGKYKLKTCCGRKVQYKMPQRLHESSGCP